MSYIVAFLVLTLVGRIQEVLTPLGYLKPVAFAMVVGAIVLFVSFPYDRLGDKWYRPSLFFILMLVGFIASIPTSLYPSKSIEFIVLTFSCTMFLHLIVAQCVARFRVLENVALTLLAMSILLGVGLIVVPKRLITDTGFRYSVSDAYDSNDLALVFAMSIPFIFYCFWRHGFLVKFFAIAAALFAAAGIHLTGSRGGLLALATVMIYMFLRVKELGVVLRTLILVGMIGGGALATQTDTFQRLISSVQGKEYNWTEEDGRIQIWQRGLGYIAGHPVTGVGITCFEIAEGLISGRSTTSRGVRWAAAHNSYVQVCAETGIPAFLFWLLTILSSVRELNRQKTLLEPWNDLPDVRCMLAFGAVARTSLVTYLVGAVFLSMGYLVYLYLIVGMTIALARLTDERVAQLEESDDEEDEDETDQLDTADAALSSA